jgi:hypothetical protein
MTPKNSEVDRRIALPAGPRTCASLWVLRASVSREGRSIFTEDVAYANSLAADPSISREIEFAHPTG